MKKLIALALMLALCLQLISCDLLDLISDGANEIQKTEEEAAREVAEQIVNFLLMEMPEMPEDFDEFEDFDYLEDLQQFEADLKQAQEELFCDAALENEDLLEQIYEMREMLKGYANPKYSEEITVTQDFQLDDSGISKFVLFVSDYAFSVKAKEAEGEEAGEATTATFKIGFVMAVNYAEDPALVGLHSITLTSLETGESTTVGVEGLVTPPTNG